MLELTTRDLAQDALSSLADGVTLVDDHARIVLLNPRAQELFDVRASEWLGKEIGDLYRVLAAHSIVGDSLTERLAQMAARAAEMPRLEFTLREPHEWM